MKVCGMRRRTGTWRRRRGGPADAGRLRAWPYVLAIVGVFVQGDVAVAAACTRDDFAAVVDDASDTLRTLNADNTPKFQAKLRSLKDRRKWNHDEFMKQAAPFVQDDKIQGLDEQTATLLNKIQGLGEGGGGREPDCALLNVLKAHMRDLVETTQAKWTYMNGKIDTALAAAN